MTTCSRSRQARAGVASAFVLVGMSAWVLPLLAAQRRASWSGWVFAGVGTGNLVAGLVGLAAGLLGKPPAQAWLFLGACAAVVALALWRPMAATSPLAAPGGSGRGALPADTWRPVLCHGAFGFGYIVPATFLPAAARQLVADPVAFGWTWPLFGLAAAASTVASSVWWRGASPRRLWAGAQLVMAAGVLAPAIRMTVPTLLFSAACVGGTFMVVTMAGMEDAWRWRAPRLMATMTAAFALGQLVGPFTVTFLPSSSAGALAVPHTVAAAALLLGLFALVVGSSREQALRARSTTKGDRR